MKAQQRIFFDFLRFCIGATTEGIPESVKDADWGVLYGIAKKQALIGVLQYPYQCLFFGNTIQYTPISILHRLRNPLSRRSYAES